MCDPLNESTVWHTPQRTIRASSLSFNSVGVRISNSSAAAARFLSEDDGGGCLMHEQESPHVVESARNRLYLRSPDEPGSCDENVLVFGVKFVVVIRKGVSINLYSRWFANVRDTTTSAHVRNPSHFDCHFRLFNQLVCWKVTREHDNDVDLSIFQLLFI